MRNDLLLAISIGALTLPLAACNEPSNTAAAEQTFGPSPTLPAPQNSWIPTVNVATATGWPAGGKPTAANGMAVNAFATGLDHPRTVYVLPNGDVLVAETNAPPKPDDAGGIKGWVTKLVMSRAGAGTASAEPHHPAARCRRRRRRRNQKRFSRRPEFAVRHGAGRRRFLCRRFRRDREISLS